MILRLPVALAISGLALTAPSRGGLPSGNHSAGMPLPPMQADRPDTTESPFTVPAGHWQFELETVSVSLDGGQRGCDWGSVNIKYGLNHRTDLQLVTPAWHDGEGLEGWTDAELRLKWSLTGNDAPVAAALMPYLKLPVASRSVGNGHIEGGLILPFNLPGLSATAMVEAAVMRNQTDDGYTGSVTVSASRGFDLTDRLSPFVELVAVLPFEESAEAYFNAGLIYEIHPEWTLDAGINAGLNDDATDLRLFTGMTRRF